MKIQRSLTSFLSRTITNLFFISFALIHIPSSFCEDGIDEFKVCGIVYSCGELVNISYPFWGNGRPEICGRPEFELKCEDNETTTIDINFWEYKVLKVNQSDRRITFARSELFNDLCAGYWTTILDGRLFKYSSNDKNITIWYDCPYQNDITPALVNFKCGSNNGDRTNYYSKSTQMKSTPYIRGCKVSITVPVAVESFTEGIPNGTAALERALKQGFDVEYGDLYSMACEECKKSSGRCAANATYPFYCICGNGSNQPFMCVSLAVDRLSPLAKILIIVASGCIVVIILIIYGYYRMKRSREEREIEKTIKKHTTNSTPKRYSYSKLKKITESFQNKLGQGGFSRVYKGRLPDGRDVAVKLLNESMINAQDFVNEVVSITQTSHVNVVTLLGFCCDKNKRALIYEYMPNGSLEKYVCHKEELSISKSDFQLDWKTLNSIVVGVARGLEYLHRGCNTRIVHFDIKPHNILLDSDFCPKISDFGLAKQCKAKENHVSLTGAKGTAGFIAPEVIFRNIGRVSHKSDVYSYGMLILEMVGQRKGPKKGMSQSSEEYFPDWIYEDLTQAKDHGGFCWGNTEEEEEIVKKMIIVGLCCIQTMPDERPSMTDVVAMLEGSENCLPVPPKPALFSPTVLPQASFSSSAS